MLVLCVKELMWHELNNIRCHDQGLHACDKFRVGMDEEYV